MRRAAAAAQRGARASQSTTGESTAAMIVAVMTGMTIDRGQRQQPDGAAEQNEAADHEPRHQTEVAQPLRHGEDPRSCSRSISTNVASPPARVGVPVPASLVKDPSPSHGRRERPSSRRAAHHPNRVSRRLRLSPRSDDDRARPAPDHRCMSTVTPHRRGAASPTPTAPGTTADVLVAFGITGDLAKQMTLRSLYRLERRGLLNCPIVGVAVQDWSDDDLRERAREAIVDGGETLDARGLRPLRRAALLPGRRLRRRRHLRAPGRGARRQAQPGLLPRDPAVPVRHRGQGAVRGRAAGERPRRGREAVRPRPRVGARARGGDAHLPRRVAAVPDRPLPGEDGARRDPPPAVRQRDARAGLEPALRRVGPDHDGRGLRRRGPRALLRPGRRAARRRRQPPDAGRRRDRDGGAGGPRPADAEGRDVHDLPRDAGRPTRRATCAASTTATATSRASRPTPRRRPTPRWRSRSTTGAGRRAVLHPHRQAAAGHPDRAAARVPALAAARASSTSRTHPEPNQLVVKLDPSTGVRLLLDAQRARLGGAGADPARHGVRGRGRRGPGALRGAAAGGDQRRQHALHAPGRRRGGVAGDAAAARRAPAGPPLRARHLGPGRRRRAASARHGRWHAPWVAS